MHYSAGPAIDTGMKLTKHLVDKTWERTDIPAEFGTLSRHVADFGEVAFHVREALHPSAP